MSFLVFEQEDGQFHGVMVFDASEDATVEYDHSNNLHEYRINTKEGSGAWFVTDPVEGHWGTILRRDDTPYNDCLPPSETLLSGAFRDGTELDERIKHIQSEAENGFYNPFNALVGSPENGKLLLLKQTFQGHVQTVDEGYHVASDHSELDRPEADFLKDLKGVPDRNPLMNIVDELTSPDGLRRPSAVLDINYENGTWAMSDVVSSPPDGDWTDRTP